jgi:dihydroorotate dehydrogenase
MTASTTLTLARYEPARAYEWNYDHAPDPVEADVPAVPGEWTFCGLRAASPLGMPAGPLLNGMWIRYYASLGFDVLTYKTVRSSFRECYVLPNLLPVRISGSSRQLSGGEIELPAAAENDGSWAVSFGMPSMRPDTWRADIEDTRQRLAAEKLLSVSVVGTVQSGWSTDDLAADYAQCARWAVDAGADAIEMNFSCPNVATCDGQLYQEPVGATIVAAAVRQAIGSKPLIAKVGHVSRPEHAESLLNAIEGHVDALAMTNSVAATVKYEDGTVAFDGQKRGICGAATRRASTNQAAMFSNLIQSRGTNTRLIGVGGAATADDVRDYLKAGAECVHIATAAMIDPSIGLRIRAELAEDPPQTD